MVVEQSLSGLARSAQSALLGVGKLIFAHGTEKQIHDYTVGMQDLIQLSQLLEAPTLKRL